MALEFKIGVDISPLYSEVAAVNEAVFPLVTQAIERIAIQAKKDWQGLIYNAHLWSGWKQPYMESIQYRMTGPFSAEIWSDYRMSNEIESGMPSRDLKKMLDSSSKVRRTKDGRRFLVIPLRHNVPGATATGAAMPEAVHTLARQLAASTVAGHGQRPAGQMVSLQPGQGMRALRRQTPFLSNPQTQKRLMVPSMHYSWGEHLQRKDMKGMSAEDKRKYAGMYRFDTSSGGSSRSTYMTFRIMMEGSRGWVVPAKPGIFAAKQVAERLQPLAEAAIGEAVKRTLGG